MRVLKFSRNGHWLSKLHLVSSMHLVRSIHKEGPWFSILKSAEIPIKGAPSKYLDNSLFKHCQKLKVYKEKLYTFMVSFIISSLNTPQSFISLLDIFPNFSHKSIIAYWTFLPDKRFLISKFKLRIFLGEKKKKTCCFSWLSEFV